MKNQRGSILAIVIIFIFIFTLLGMFAMRLVVLQNEASDSELYYTRAHFAALYGSELALFNIMQWENIASSSTELNPDGRKFLAEHNSCFKYSGGKWYPLDNMSTDDMDDNFSDSITGGSGSGIAIECYVEEEAIPNVNDGYIPEYTNNSNDEAKYGTYKFYVIKTFATIYSDYAAKQGEIASAKDELHFFIAYSKGTNGSRAEIALNLPAGGNIPALPGGTGSREYIKSANIPSFITGNILPIFRYYIRGRR